ncbi:Zn-dependent M28 family amino/carboxypeptidase [Pseudoduganella flava]|uniref:M20/M25/M40 family metallo-hydrolase n=1 Tax=Pseudoduganella flava TaxID=871742 RepID=A0A562PLE7_9BURK|nr:M28 family metallopeptidase [Pseudoduganella flava]QGZ41046.1 M20/M25/M40 family metallo-hydrolase [Pseudoduganella flava]TWI45254.1 Zn-dependent M28 family amino/carboxypeptidase [Pseudoduganella flava]
MKKTLLATLLFAAFAAHADNPTFDPQRLSQHVKVLASDEFEGRGPNTAGEKKTIAYLVEQFKAAGLQPGGDMVKGKRVWTQEVPLGRFEIKGPVTLTVGAGKDKLTYEQGEQMAVRAAMNGKKLVDFKNAPLVFVGYGVTAPERNWDDFKGVDLKGKLAVVLINDPDFETGAGDFGGKAMTYYGRWTYKYEELARRGALGTIIVHETAPASYGWATVKNSNTNVMYDIVRKDPAKSHAPMEAWIQRDAVADLFKRAGLDFDTAKKAAQSRDFKPMPLNGVTLTAHYAVDAQVIKSQNVAARIAGTERPDETVIYSGHWDHLGVGLPDAKGDKIYNGAVDNATGIAALLELARAYAKAPAPKRSVAFLAVTAEEKGLLGSEYYAANPLYPLEKTVGVINMDALSPFGPARNFTISGSAKLDLLDQLIAKARARNQAYAPDPKPEAGHFFRSDHFPFAKRGVPAVSFGSGEDWVEGGVAAGKGAEDKYVTDNYHQPSDEWSAQWPFTGMASDLQLLYGLGRDLAESRDWPNWAKDSEFREIRDKSAGTRK